MDSWETREQKRLLGSCSIASPHTVVFKVPTETFGADSPQYVGSELITALRTCVGGIVRMECAVDKGRSIEVYVNTADADALVKRVNVFTQGQSI